MSELREKVPAPSKATPPKATGAKGSDNGQSTLSDRVRSLRLNSGHTTARPRSAWLPWGLALIALATAGLFGWRGYYLANNRTDAASETVGDNASGKSSAAAARANHSVASTGAADSAANNSTAPAASAASAAKWFSIPRATSSRPTRFRSARKSGAKSSGSIHGSRKGQFTKREKSWPRSTRSSSPRN